MMKKLLIIILWLTGITINAATYYVATTGNDAASGDITHPWATWGKALTDASLNPGDIVYFRGGVYAKEYTNGRSVGGTLTGTVTDSIFIFNYPGEVPILDCSNTTSTTYWAGHNQGVVIEIHYVHIRGLVVRNVLQLTASDVVTSMFEINYGTHSIVENCTTYNGGGTGIRANACDYVYFKNCDSYNHYDPLSPSYPGNDGNGFWAWDQVYTDRHVYFQNCRAWKCGDQGFSIYSHGYVELDGCWSFRNGLLQGEGHGVKLGMQDPLYTVLKRSIKRCLFVYNRDDGIETNDAGGYALPSQIYNNTIYHNGFYPGYDNFESGLVIFNTLGNDANELNRTYRNNIVYNNEKNAIWTTSSALYTHEYNSWEIPITLTDADFLSVDSTGLSGTRQLDGSLPNLNFLKLASTSDLIDKGIDVGLDYSGSAPDVGYAEYAAQDPPVDHIVLSVTSIYPNVTYALVTSIVSDDGGAAVTARGVCWNTSVNPTTANSHTTDGTGDGTFNSTMTPLLPNTTYHMRAYATNSNGTDYSDDETFQTLSETETLFVGSGGKVVTSGGKIVNNK